LTSFLESIAQRTAAALRASEEIISPVGVGGDDVLHFKLEECRLAPSLILPKEIDRLRERASRARNDVEKAAFEWKMSAVAFQIEEAARVATLRLSLFESLKTSDDKEREKERAKDTIHWFQHYAWGYDPRSALKVRPFYPYPRQEHYLNWLDETVFERVTSGVVEKSRDEGATVGALDWMVKNWLYVAGFSAFLVSATEDLVDTSKDPDTLFEKIRFQLRLTPSWMLPKGFNLLRDMPYMNVANPENGATITGGAPTENVGRQRRATVVLADEFQGWPGGGFKQSTALSQTSYSVIKLGTPLGTLNQYYVDTHADDANVFVLDWHENPLKDERWYNSLPFGYISPRMTEEEIAQEVDRNYEASQPGRVIKNCREEYCFITWSELIEGFKPHKLDHLFVRRDGRRKIPDIWNWGRVSDYGISAKTEDDTHIWAYNLFARPQEGHPFSDSLFFFYALPVKPIGASELEAYTFYSKLERELGVRGEKGLTRTPQVNDMSHEAKDARSVLEVQCGDHWRIPKLDFFDGVSKLRFHFELTDQLKPNPFRPALKGRSRIYFVAPDGEYQLSHNPRLGHFVTPSQTQRGFKRLRAEIGAWHFPPEERGKPIQQMRPKPVFDDIITTIRYALARWGVTAAPMSERERLEAADPKLKELRERAATVRLSDAEEYNYFYRLEQAKKLVKPRVQEFDEWLEPVE
jgi:hypothetical protein